MKKKWKVSNGFLLFGVLLQTSLLIGQDGVLLRFSKDFSLPAGAKISYGKKVLLTGPRDSSTTKLVVSWSVGIQEGAKEAVLSDTTWSLLIGPFPIREEVIFQFQVTSNFSPKFLKGLVRKAMTHFVDSLIKRDVANTLGEYKRLAVELLPDIAPRNLQKYKTVSGETLYELLIDAVAKLDSNKVLSLVQSINESEHQKRDLQDQLSYLEDNLISKLDYTTMMNQFDQKSRPALLAILKRIKESPSRLALESETRDSLKAAINESTLMRTNPTLANSLMNRLIEIGDLGVTIDTLEKSIAGLTGTVVDEASWPLEQVKEFSWVSETTAEVSDLEYYAGFDVGALAVSDFGVVPFFTVNMYIKRVEIDKDPRRVDEACSLSAGIALKTSDIPTDGVTYYVGVGYRLNKLFRITLGSSLYKTVDTKKLVGKASIGLSLDFRYVADLLKIFSGASANLTPQ
jgi:hypothetical protein